MMSSPVKSINILLMQAPINIKQEDANYFGTYPPLGLAYIAAVLEQEGYTVAILDCQGEAAKTRIEEDNGLVRIGIGDREIIQRLKNFSPDVVGVGNMFTSFSEDCLALARLVRSVLPEVLLVMGGAHATIAFEDVLHDEACDAVVLGEGEFIMRDLVAAYASGDNDAMRKLPGTVWKARERLINNGYPGPIKDIDQLPFPAYHLMPMEKYIWQRHANFSVSRRWPIAHMITTRGCLYNCLFCSTKRHYKKFRARSPESIIEEMQLLIDRYGVREFHFHDDSFMSKANRVRALCELMIKHKLDVCWQVSQGINSVGLDEELLTLMHKAGMYRVGFPIESGHPDILRFIRKPVRLEQVKKLIVKCNELGIYSFGCFMVGFPNETRGQIKSTMNFVLDSGLDYAKVSIVQPLAGSELYGIYEELGLVGPTPQHGSTYFHTEYDTLHLKAEELNKIRSSLMRRFALKRIMRMLTLSGLKQYMLPKLRTVEDCMYFIRMVWLALRGT